MDHFKTSEKIPNPKPLMENAALIYEYTYTTAESLVSAFEGAKKTRNSPRGVLSDLELDILRAALVMACAGLDGSLKNGIRSCLGHLLNTDSNVKDGFEKFIRKRIGGENDILETGGGTKFLARILADESPRLLLVEEYIRELTGDSLQSVEEVFRTANALGIDQKQLDFDVRKLRSIFQVRNMIIHELDIDLDAPKRKKRVRSQVNLLNDIDYILNIAYRFLVELNKKMP